VFRGSTTSVAPERTKRYGLGSTTAREMVEMIEQIQCSDRCRPFYKQAMLNHLAKNEDKNKFKRFLPDHVMVAHKDGSVDESRTDAGIIHTRAGIVAVCVLTDNNKDQSWKQDNEGNRLCALVAKEVYDYFVPAKQAQTKRD
jgi:hypothetical protein